MRAGPTDSREGPGVTNKEASKILEIAEEDVGDEYLSEALSMAIDALRAKPESEMVADHVEHRPPAADEDEE